MRRILTGLGWISAQNDLGVEMKNLSDDYSLLIQGPAVGMQSLTSKDLS
jgi:aminomethyltransferase